LFKKKRKEREMLLSSRSVLYLIGAVVVLASLASLSSGLQPIIYVPGYSLSKLHVVVKDGTVPGCPTDGEFTVTYQMEKTQNGFSEGCMLNYIALLHETDSKGKKVTRFKNRPDVYITIPGRENGDASQCIGSDIYDGAIEFFLSKGYTIGGDNATFRGGCWDWRVDPYSDIIPGRTWFELMKHLTKEAYRSAGNKKVYYIAHSNGPMMVLNFLNRVGGSFKRKYVAGFFPQSGDFAGQGLFPAALVKGLSISDFSFNPDTVAAHWTFSQNYFSFPQPQVFANRQETILQVVDPPLTLQVSGSDIDTIMRGIGNTFGLKYWRDYYRIINVDNPPYVPTFANWGAGLPTATGIKIDNFKDANILDYFLALGDTNQEDADNTSPEVWKYKMRPGCYTGTPVPGVGHFQISSNPETLEMMWKIISGPVPTVKCGPKKHKPSPF